jgi:DNA repair exonuclease SbcCD ATPase subunit
MTDNTNNNIEESKSTIDTIIREIKAKIQHNEAIENQFLSNTYDEINRINTLIDEKLKGLGENTEKLGVLNNNIIAQESDIAELNKQLTEMKKKQEELEEENTNLKLSNNANEVKVKDYDNISQRNEELIKDMERVQNEKESLEQEKKQLEQEKTQLEKDMEGKVRDLQVFIDDNLTSIEDKETSKKMKNQIEEIKKKLESIDESKKEEESAPEELIIPKEPTELDYKGKWNAIKKNAQDVSTLLKNNALSLNGLPKEKFVIYKNQEYKDGYLILKRKDVKNIYTINDLEITRESKLYHFGNNLGFYNRYSDSADKGWLMREDQLDALYNNNIAKQNGGKKKSKYYTRKMKMVGGYRYVGNPFGSSPSPLIIEDPKKKARKSSRKSSRKSKRTLRSNKESKAKLSKGGKRKQRKTRKQKKIIN